MIAEQLKFRACLKILMTELRTLATGFEVDGGKLRFQLYSWLEKEIAAMHTICNYKVSSTKFDLDKEIWEGSFLISGYSLYMLGEKKNTG